MNERIRIRLLALATLALALGLSSCQTYQVPITYADPTTIKPGPSTVDLGRFADERDGRGATLGSIRNEVGIPIKTLTTRKPVAELVHNAVGYGLKARGMLVGQGQGNYILAGTINEFYAHQFASQEAGCTIRFELYRRGRSNAVFSKTYKAQRNRHTTKVSYFGDVDEVAEVSSEALQEVIDQALDDPEFRKAIR